MVKVCEIEGCSRKYKALGLCDMHYLRSRYHPIQRPPLQCLKPDCTKPIWARGYCRNHYTRARDNNLTITFSTKICNVNNCNNGHYAKGYCLFHYQRNKAGVDLYREKKVLSYNGIKCKFYVCDKQANSKGYCQKHYRKFERPESSGCNIDYELYIHMMNVRFRDKNHCKWYGCSKCAKNGDTIQVNHIFPQSEYPELKNVEKYMICYCKSHHGLFHQYRGDLCANLFK